MSFAKFVKLSKIFQTSPNTGRIFKRIAMPDLSMTLLLLGLTNVGDEYRSKIPQIVNERPKGHNSSA